MIDILINARDEEGNKLNNEQILDNLLTFIFASTDTTSSTLSICIYQLLIDKNKDIY